MSNMMAMAQAGRGASFENQNYPGMVAKGNIDLYNRPQVKNADGSISTVRSMSFSSDGREVLVPTVSPDGRIWSNEEAIQNYFSTGQHLGVFDTTDNATNYALKLHQQQDKYYTGGKHGKR